MKTKLQRCSIRFGTSGGQHFFGYYDVSPLDREGRRLLTHRVKEANRMPRAEDMVEIGVWDIDSGQYRRLADTSAYNEIYIWCEIYRVPLYIVRISQHQRCLSPFRSGRPDQAHWRMSSRRPWASLQAEDPIGSSAIFLARHAQR